MEISQNLNPTQGIAPQHATDPRPAGTAAPRDDGRSAAEGLATGGVLPVPLSQVAAVGRALVGSLTGHGTEGGSDGGATVGRGNRAERVLKPFGVAMLPDQGKAQPGGRQAREAAPHGDKTPPEG